MATVLDILKYVLPSLVVLICAATIVGRFLKSAARREELGLLRESRDTTLRLRLQAYERLVLFLERTHPRQLVPRVYMPGMSVRDLQLALTAQINSEYEHNLSQQLYIGRGVWNAVQHAREQQLNVINAIAQQLAPDTAAKELHRRLIEALVSSPEPPAQEIALQLIHQEAASLLQ